ncbi:MAG: hypothetical protein JOZ17_19095 [Acetobacteraceae bacterium]|nr:hypothetical protein [Acetobacteraceae bacterium]
MGKDVWRVRIERDRTIAPAASVTVTHNETTVFQKSLQTGTQADFDLLAGKTAEEPSRDQSRGAKRSAKVVIKA